MTDTVFVVHIYYIDMLEELRQHLDGLRCNMDFDIVATVPDNFGDYEIDMINRSLKCRLIKPFENRGRDVLPFLSILPYIKDYKYSCKLHTMRDKRWRFGPPFIYASWRNALWSVLTDPANAKKAKYAIDQGQGFFAPEEIWLRHGTSPLEKDKKNAVFERNLKNMNILSELFGFEMLAEAFVAGTMFWFRPSSLTWLSSYDLDILFEPEQGADDGKMEHAFERCFHQLLR